MSSNQGALIRELLAQKPIVRSQELTDHGITRSGLLQAVQRKDLVRVAQGIFASNAAEADPDLGDAVACLTTGGIICHRTAGARHGLTDDLPNEIEILVPRTQCRTPLLQPVRIVRSQIPASFEVGIETRQALGVEIRMTNRPRTVVDLLRGPIRQHGVAAVHTFLAENGSGQDLQEVAEAFGVWDKVGPVVEGVLQAMSRTIRP